jgi:hypothetical protein
VIGGNHRVFRLKSWLVRALIPEGKSGTYLLYQSGRPVYAGRSDEDLRSRLVTHARFERAEHFGFDVFPDAHRAFDMECALFHSLGPKTNLIHPASPKSSGRTCFICGTGGKEHFFRVSANKPTSHP